MANIKLWLVHNSIDADKADADRQVWGFENAIQPELFDDLDSFKLYVFAISEIDYHSFMRDLAQTNPKLIIDMRSFPDFFGIFESTKGALSEFKRRRIAYASFGASGEASHIEEWEKWSQIKKLTSDVCDAFPGSSVFFFASNKYKRDLVLKSLDAYFHSEFSKLLIIERP